MLRGEYFDHAGVAIDPVAPVVNIVDPFDTTVVAAGVPVHDGVGLYHYEFPIPPSAPLGVWEVTWLGEIVPGTVSADDDSLEVLLDAAMGSGVGVPTGPCDPWCIAADLCMDLDDVETSAVDRAIEDASYLLWSMSARMYGTCTVTVRPCKRGGCPMPPSFWRWPASSLPAGGAWLAVGCCSRGNCACRNIDHVVLDGPVAEVLGVRIDGQPLGGDAWQLYDWKELYRSDGESWPTCQDLSLPDTEEGTWSITYTMGLAVPGLGRRAAGELAAEYVKACTGGPCRLPSRMQSISRQGLTISRIDPSELKGIGLQVCDQFIKAVNPAGLAMPSGVYSPDMPNRHRRPT